MSSDQLRSWARWLTPVVATGALALLLSPGFAGQRAEQEAVRAKSAGRASTLAKPAFVDPSLGLSPDPELEEYAALAPSLQDESALSSPVRRQRTAASAGSGSAASGGAAAEEGAADPAAPLDCVIEPNQTIHLGSPVIGAIQTVHVDRGDLVEAGQPVAEIESTVEQAAVEVARARARMQGEVKSREARAELGERRQVRADELFDRSALSLDQREQLETEARLARLELQQARENRRLAALELDQALAALKRRTIRSPVAGIVVDRLMSPGEVVEDDTILTLAQIDPLRVEVILPAARFGSIQRGMRAAVVPEIPGDRVHVAKVTVVDRLIDAASGTFGVRLELPNPDHAIPGGLHCEVRFLAD